MVFHHGYAVALILYLCGVSPQWLCCKLSAGNKALRLRTASAGMNVMTILSSCFIRKACGWHPIGDGGPTACCLMTGIYLPCG